MLVLIHKIFFICLVYVFFFFQAEDGIRDRTVTGVQTCALPISVIWQNRSAYRTAVAKIADRGTTSDGKRRRRENVVAAYWQRYCSKNDTIGFFGPLGWGVIRDDGPAVAVRSRGIVTAREVHFESWCMEALASAIDPTLVVPLNAWPEVDLRMQLEARGNVEGLQALERMEKSRAAVAEAKG